MCLWLSFAAGVFSMWEVLAMAADITRILARKGVSPEMKSC